jgi:eukaryotic-like serine/threonine-protein kinase
MPLTSGTKLGPYEILCPLGAGGMGEVYRATDTRLDRSVAIKVLASQLSSSPELKQRMEREARAISAMNHSHICQLYDIGSQNGTDYLVMEFLEGETLADRLHRGAMPLNEVLRVGIAISEALTAAHRQGVVHRDLKPGNIMLTKGGAKLMDFGLAKPLGMQAAGASSAGPPSFTATATLSRPSPLSPLTTAGNIVGTVQYMSPEQIEGKEADARSDIFALGAVLYEMACGRRPFEGKSQISLASSILEKDPEPISSINPQIPIAFEHVLTTCLQKNPDDRFQSAHDAKLQLQWIAAEKSSPKTSPLPPTTARDKERLAWTAAVLGAIVAGAIIGFFLFHPRQSARTMRTVINPPLKYGLNLMGDFAGPPVLSPDGSSLAFTAIEPQGKTTLWVRPMDSLDARMLPGTEGAIFPFWSPDGSALGFFADTKLKTIDINNSTAQVLADAPFGRGGAWGPDGVIVYSGNTQAPLMRVSANGGTPIPVTQLDSGQHTSHRWPFFLPDGKHFLYLAIHHDPSKSANDTLYFASLDGRENRPLFRSESNAIYADGYLLFARGDQLMAQAFNPGSGTLSGTPVSIAKGLAHDVSTWHMDASASDNGLLILGSGGSADWQLVWVDRTGKQIGTVADKLTNLQLARISPQEDRIALQIDNAQSDIWVLDVARGVRSRLTFGPVANQAPVWSPDGKWIAYASGRNGHSELYRKPSDGSGGEELLLTDNSVVMSDDWSRDGKYLIYSKGSWGSNWEIWALPVEGDRKPFMVVPHATSRIGANGHLSPNGNWIAYASDESGTVEVYVAAVGRGQGKWQISSNGGAQPLWSKDGKELYFMDLSFNLYAISVKEVGSALQFGAPQMLVSTSNYSAPLVFYDVSRDKQKILIDRVSQQVGQSVTVVTNFTVGLRAAK